MAEYLFTLIYKYFHQKKKKIFFFNFHNTDSQFCHYQLYEIRSYIIIFCRMRLTTPNATLFFLLFHPNTILIHFNVTLRHLSFK